MSDGADLLCATLEALGVECVFGLPGTQNVALYEALRRTRIRSVVANHELAASFMANGYYRASGKIAPLITIPGPGFTYALTGLAEAFQDSVALVHLVGQPPRGERKFLFQALDQRGIAGPLVKAALQLDEADAIPATLARAFDLASSGEPGPVLVEWSLAALEGAPGAAARATPPRRPAPAAAPDRASLEEAMALLRRARRPVLMAGQGCAGAAGRLRELAELLGAAVLTTTSGRGVLPEDHALALGFEFVRGDIGALNAFLEHSDGILAVGCKLTYAGTSAFTLRLPADRLVHVDASPEVLGATYRERLSIVATAEAALEELVEGLRRAPAATAGGWGAEELAGWRRRLRAVAEAAAPEPAVHGTGAGTAAAFFAALRQALPRDGIVVTDSGTHQTLARRHLEVLSPRGLIVPSDFQSMGFGLPAAIGAKLAAPERAVVAMLGDGGFAISGMDLLTVARERVPLTIVVFNDGRFNRIRLEQLARYGHSHGVDLQNPDFEAFAGAMGLRYARAEGDVEGVLTDAIRDPGPTLVEVAVGDSAAIHLSRARGLVRGTTRRALGPHGIRWLKQLLPRRAHRP